MKREREEIFAPYFYGRKNVKRILIDQNISVLDRISYQMSLSATDSRAAAFSARREEQVCGMLMSAVLAVFPCCSWGAACADDAAEAVFVLEDETGSCLC